VTKRRGTARDVSIGIVVTVAAVIFGITIFSIGSEQRLWASKIEYRLSLPTTNGLQVGAPVRLAGVQVGTVTDILLPLDPNRVDIEIHFSVDSAVASRIREDSKATLKILSLLAGDRFVELTQGSPSAPVLAAGAFVSTPEEVTLEELQALGATIADDLLGVTGALRVLLEQLQNKETFLGKAFFDPNFGEQSFGGIRRSIKRTEQILEKIDSGGGMADRLLTDEELADSLLSKLDNSLGRLEVIVTRMADEQGTLAKALDPNGPVNSILANLEQSTGSLLAITERLEAGEGVAGKLLSDEEYAEEILGTLQGVTQELKEILEKVNNGDGAASAFLNDPALYEDVQDILHGIKKSRMMSWLIRHYKKKGEKVRSSDEAKLVSDAEGEGL
jgi:phospholipid/cholesterol/gamma-HCH transport system substrate-binding protein